MAVEGVAQQLGSIFDEFSERLDAKTDDIMYEAARDTAKDLRETSPKGKGRKSGEYARSWTWKKDKHRYIVHNKDHYRLTHLLNNGHVIKNKYGTYGRTLGDGHIRRAEQRAIERLFRKLNDLV